jgi:hypothetical protein
MTGKQNHPRDLSAIGGDPSRQRGTWKHIGGSPSDDWNNRIAVDTVAATRLETDARAREEQYQAAINGLIGIAPQDETEAMMAAQMLALHGAAMDHYRRAVADGDLAYARHQEVGMACKLTRAFAALTGALHRHRGRASQKITVEHVHVQGAGEPAPAAPGAGENKIVEINPMQSPRGGRARDGGRGVDAKVGN